MTEIQMAHFSRDCEKLMEEYKTHPAVLLFQQKGSGKQYVLFFGNPSIEWISKAGEGMANQLETIINQKQIKGTY